MLDNMGGNGANQSLLVPVLNQVKRECDTGNVPPKRSRPRDRDRRGCPTPLTIQVGKVGKTARPHFK
jgi:hypothetical protein